MSLLYNKAKCRRALLDYATQNRHHKFSRVSDDAYARIEAAIRKTIREIVDSTPSKGKTLG